MKVIPPVSFHDFIHEYYPTGIGATYEIVENLIRNRPDVLALWVEVTKRKAGAPEGNRNAAKSEEQESETTFDNVKDCILAPTGNSAAAGLRTLQKHASEGNEKAQEELAAVVAGTKKVHRACVDAGLRKSTRIDADTGRMLPNVYNVNERAERPTGNSAAAGLRPLLARPLVMNKNMFWLNLFPETQLKQIFIGSFWLPE